MTVKVTPEQVERFVSAVEKMASALSDLGFGDEGSPGALEGHTMHMDNNYRYLSDAIERVAEAIEELNENA